MEQCPVPTLLEHGSSSQVLFHNVDKYYVPGEDVMCCYTLTEKFIPRRRDWIGIFKVGWKTPQEYYSFMWAPLPSKESDKCQEIEFKAYYLPKDEEHYQFCYVDEDGVVQGTSISFQFCPDPEDIMVIMNKEKVEELEQLREELYQENQDLRDKYANLHEQLLQKQVALDATQRINKLLEQEMKEKVSWEKEKASWERELRWLKEYNQKMISEKEEMGMRVEELQTLLETQEKKMEKLMERLEEKTEQLEEFRKENQYDLDLTEQNHLEMLQQFKEMLKKNKATINVVRVELKREGPVMRKQLKDFLTQYDLIQKEKDLLQKEYESLKNQVSVLQNENEALQSFLDNKDFSSYELPSPRGNAEPMVPSNIRISVLFFNHKISYSDLLSNKEMGVQGVLPLSVPKHSSLGVSAGPDSV
ncbi:calcium-binding and coiled-coil domain-containing protein 2 [Apodemus sylvaticus]|uniref:calcium-binding and coiled-coil domain-containing protein 2 n=1 Tax=Apodemus sylvaticus TaxID=10129 RepID=UPI0022425F6D|nr:calcium-binding and coiled-coil domain-containing protein 2 [Apodemus sylvaticus]